MAKNLILVVLDTLRHPLYLPGFAEGTAMPFLARLGEGGVGFDHAIASSSWTPPSHVSLLSGVDPWETHFHVASKSSTVPAAPFLADLWQRNGGETFALSTNWLVDPDIGTARGYEQFNVGLPTWLSGLALQGIQVAGFEQLMYASLATRATRTRPRSVDPLGSTLQFVGASFHRALRSAYSGTRLHRALHRYLRHRTDRRPLHLFLNLMEMHEPYVSSPRRSSPGLDPMNLPSVNVARHTMVLSRWPTPVSMLVPYQAAARELDHRVEALVGMFRHYGLLDDTALLLVSDHGQGLGEHGFFGHAFYLYDELVRIPAWYFEFRNGEPTLARTRIADWVDLRHMFDLVVARTLGADDAAPDRILAKSLDTRGPASSYWEGPAPHPPRGFLLSPPVSAYHRTIRVFGPTASVALDENGIPVDVGDRSSGWDDRLVEYAEKAVRKGAPVEGGGVPGRANPEVDRRLKSWGYD